MKKYASPENKTNEWVDLPLHDIYKLVHGPTSLERTDHIAIIDELIHRLKELSDKAGKLVAHSLWPEQ